MCWIFLASVKVKTEKKDVIKMDKEFDFLFITSPTNARNPHPPYYFMYLASYLRNKGLKVNILDVKGGDKPKDIEKHKQRIAEYVALHKSSFIGLAAFHSDYPMIMELGQIINHQQPETILLVGNAHATINPEDFIYKDSPFDIAVLGEGEEVCWELWEAFRFENIKGIAYFEYSNRKLIKTEPRHVINMSTVGMPAYDLVNMKYYLKPQKLIIRRIYTSMICVFAGRGCPFDCDFCCANSIWKANKGKAARLRSPKEVIKEISHLKIKYNIDFFYLFDDMFGMSKEWMREWFERKGSVRMLRELPYACQTRADVATEEMVKGLKETRCIQLDIGVETGTQKLLDGVNKGVTLQQIRQVFSWCKKYKIRSFATMLLNLPGETLEDLIVTKSFLEELKPSAGVIFGITTPYPGTKIYEDHCCPKLTVGEYSKLIGNRLNPQEDRFRMSEHKEDLWKLLDKFNLEFKVNPMFERMWAMKPFQRLYWKAIFNSSKKYLYILCWLKDISKTFLLYWAHKLNIYRFLKKIQYKGKNW